MFYRVIQYSLILAILVLAAACTSTNAPTANTNPNYANQYQQGTRSAQVASTKDEDKKPVEVDQTVTLMQMSFEVGEILPGESYVLYAKVDNPANRGLRYQWRATSGVLENAPDEDQTRLLNMLGGKPADTTTGGVPTTDKGSTPTTTESVQSPNVNQKPESAGQGASRSRSGSKIDEEAKSADDTEEPKSAKSRSASKSEDTDVSDDDNTDDASEEANKVSSDDTEIKPTDKEVKSEEPEPKTNTRTSKADKKAKYAAKQENKSENDSIYKTFDDEDDDKESKPSKKGEEVDKSELKPGKRLIPEGVAGRAGEAIGKAATERIQSRAGTLDPKRLGGSDESLEAGEDISAPDYKEADEDGKASGRSMEFRTSIPVVRWTAAGLGKVSIKLLITDEKGQEVAGPREIEFDVTTAKPKLTLDFDEAQELTEDAFVTVNLKGSNLIDYRKGLATISFSQEYLSFRYAKIGSFFPNAAQTNFFYAQPDPNAGTITAAFSFDDETRLAEGDGVIASFTFKMRKNAEKPEDINFSLTPGPTNIYILDSSGADTLPPIDFKPEIIANNLVEPKSKAAPEQTASAGATPTTAEGQAAATAAGTEQPQTGKPADAAQQQAPGQSQSIPTTPAAGSNTAPPPNTGGASLQPQAVNPTPNSGTPPTPTETLPSTARQVGAGLWLDSATQYYLVFNPSSKQYLPFKTLEEAQRVKVELDRGRS